MKIVSVDSVAALLRVKEVQRMGTGRLQGRNHECIRPAHL